MLDSAVRRYIDPPLNRLGQAMARRGASANAVTLSGLVLGMIAAVLIIKGMFGLALLFILISRIADGLDGAIARASSPSDFGGFIDITADFLFYGSIPFAFALYAPAENAVAACFLIFSFYVNAATFLGFALLAEKRGMETRSQGVKSFYFSNGLLEGTETILFFVLLCVFPAVFAPLAYVFGVLCIATAALRTIAARRQF